MVGSEPVCAGNTGLRGNQELGKWRFTVSLTRSSEWTRAEVWIRQDRSGQERGNWRRLSGTPSSLRHAIRRISKVARGTSRPTCAILTARPPFTRPRTVS
jgi:hypothetical protein